MNTPWLFILIAWTHLSDRLFDHRWAAFASALGLCTVVLLWPLRGKRWSLRWWVVLLGVEEGLQVFLCQGAQNWWPIPGPDGMCVAYTGFPFMWYGLWLFACLAVWVLHGDNQNDRAKT